MSWARLNSSNLKEKEAFHGPDSLPQHLQAVSIQAQVLSGCTLTSPSAYPVDISGIPAVSELYVQIQPTYGRYTENIRQIYGSSQRRSGQIGESPVRAAHQNSEGSMNFGWPGRVLILPAGH
jgi:hypothetical protein